MRNYKIYLYITIGFTLFFLAIAFFTTPYFVKSTTVNLLDSHIASAKMEAQYVAEISGACFDAQSDKNVIVAALQKAISNSDKETIYLSIIDWSGKIVSYPDVTQVGAQSPDEAAGLGNMESELSGKDLYEYVQLQESRKRENTVGEHIIYLKSIPNSDLIVTSHLNVKSVHLKIQESRILFNTGILIIGLLTLLFALAVIRYLSSYYEDQLAQKASKIEDSVLNLAKLNNALDHYQKNVLEIKQAQQESRKPLEQETTDGLEKSKQRLLTYVRNELLSIPTEDIAYIYVDNTITYVIRNDGRRATTNDSLDQIFSSLDDQLFFRANRQIIVNISAIDKITKFGNSALKIQTNPASEIEIVIGKNKAAAFKQWLDM